MHALLNVLIAFLSVGGCRVVSAVSPELFSNLIPTKVLATANSIPSSFQYPQYTDTTAGIWQLFSPNTWTSGFFPVTLYALNTRKTLCGATSANSLGIADWISLGRSISTGLIPLEASNGVGHDVGFLSFPFIEELVMCVLKLFLSPANGDSVMKEIPPTKPPSQL